MTREEILKLEPDHELDRLVAEKVMGWKRTTDGAPPGCAYWKDDDGFIRATEDPGGSLNWSPSTDVAAAWEVAMKLCKSGITPEVYGLWLTKKKTEWYVVLWYSVEDLTAAARAKASTLPLAICRAALLAVMEAGNAK